MPATRDQIDFLRKYSNLKVEELAELSDSEAAGMIDEIEEKQQREADNVVPRGLGIGCFKSLLILVLLAAIGGALWLLDQKNKKMAAEEGKDPDEKVSRVEKTAPKPAPRKDGGSATSGNKPPPKPVEPPPPPKPVWPPEKYPAVCRAMETVVLLGEDGSKVEIAAGEAFHVLASPRPNIWRFQYKGKVLVGSGSRVKGKLTAVKQ